MSATLLPPCIAQDRVDLEWLVDVTASLRFAGEADTRLYCWFAKHQVLAALLEVAEALGQRAGQVRCGCTGCVDMLAAAFGALGAPLVAG